MMTEIKNAIDRSISHNEIVHISVSGDSGEALEAIHKVFDGCEDLSRIHTGETKMSKKNAVAISINGVELEVQCLLPSGAEDVSCPGIEALPVIADVKTWDAKTIEARANEIAIEFGARHGDKADAKWCLSKMDEDSNFTRLFREAKTESGWEEDHSKAKRAFLRGEVS